jgi:hypothetical protein
MNFAVM